MELYKLDNLDTIRLGPGYGKFCGNVFVIRKKYENEFDLLIDSVLETNTYGRKLNGELITRIIKDGNPVLLSNGNSFLVLKRKIDGIDYLSAIQVMEYSPEFLTLVK